MPQSHQRNRRFFPGQGPIAALAVIFCAFPALAGPPQDYDFDFVTIGAVGNRPTTESEVPGQGPPRGAVNYEYRMTRTEITAAQWHEFVVAYAPFTTQNPNDVLFTGTYTRYAPGVGFILTPGAENRPEVMNWRNAARYANWLHNSKANSAEAFETGAYDTSTFGQNAQGIATDNFTHLPGARFWIPSLDEWTKAAHYDPNRYGQGEEGYWLYPNSSNVAPVPGLPWEGGQTNAGISGAIPPAALSVGSYPKTQSPWGLLDLSGGESEYLIEYAMTQTPYVELRTKLSFAGIPDSDVFDRIDVFGSATPGASLRGLRLASVVPGSGGFAVSAVFLLSFNARRSRR